MPIPPREPGSRVLDAGDVALHTLTTWGCFVVVAAVTMFVGSIQTHENVDGLLVLVVLGAAAISFASVWLGAPVAWLVGRGMRNVPGVVPHLMVFWLLGAAASGIVLLVLSAMTGAAPGADQAGPIVAAAAVCGVCTAVGRSAVFLSARRHTRRRRELSDDASASVG